jgi:hypothetical protein
VTVLDEAYERLNGAWLENERGFVNHGPMACEALCVMGLDTEIAAWADRSARPRRSNARASHGLITEWEGSLGQSHLLDEWVGHFAHHIKEFGWRDTVAIWVPRLMPSMAAKLFHALIRTAHATRAIDAVDSQPRREELAFALGYWASRFEYGRSASSPVVPGPVGDLERENNVGDVQNRIAEIANRAAHRFVARPDVFTLHGVTGAMAVHLLAAHIPVAAARLSVDQLEGTHRTLFGDSARVATTEPRGFDRPTLAIKAVHTRDVHAVKLTEAAFRGFDATGDPIFWSAAELVSRTST